MSDFDFDAAIVGGGINGCGIARDAAGRGLRTLLTEQNDLASGTSSASTNLIHGGLRYLEHRAFRLVREALRERETLLRIAPHIVRPMRFVLPCVAGMRPKWLMRCGLLLYDALGRSAGATTPTTRYLDLQSDPAGAPLAGLGGAVNGGFEYSDCWADDSRLVIANALDAARRGAKILTRAKCEKARAEKNGWTLTLRLAGRTETTQVRARCLVNAAGPWASLFLTGAGIETSRLRLRLVQGSHLVLPKMFDGERAYLLPNPDRRFVFAIPYEGRFTLVGATDSDFNGDPAAAQVGDEETDYLLATVRRFFGGAPSEGDIARRFCGVRALADDGAKEAKEASRDYVLRLDYVNNSPLLNVMGGKLTTYRKLAENALAMLRRRGVFDDCPAESWTGNAPLPGGDMGGAETVAQALSRRQPMLPSSFALRLARAYGSEALRLLPADGEGGGHANSHSAENNGWGECFGGDLFAREVDYLMREEWARRADDVLWRRGRLGLSLTAAQAGRLDAYMRSAEAAVHA